MQWSIGRRLALGFGVLLLLVVLTDVLAFVGMRTMRGQLEAVINSNIAKMTAIGDMSSSVNAVTGHLRAMLSIDDSALESEAKKLLAVRERYDQAAATLEKLSSTEAMGSVIQKIKRERDLTRAINDRIIALARDGVTVEGNVVLLREAGPANQRWLNTLNEATELQSLQNEEDKAAAQSTYQKGIFILTAICLLSTVFGVLVAYMISRSITKQLGGEPSYAAKVAREIAAGNLRIPINLHTGDTDSLLWAMESMRNQLTRLVSNVVAGADLIASGVTHIANGNADLSHRTELQAANLEKTASTMGQMAQTVRTNADTARQASLLAQDASSVATKGGKVVADVVATMQEITSSSRKISDIISVIDGIAFQTNILALNAAVEAARAGEQGRGFAVVASEVRSLASRSAEAAKEIKKLIVTSVEKVEIGSSQVDEAGHTMNNIVAQVQSVSELIAQISTATSEQTEEIHQVSAALSEVDHVTQQNAALVEEAAAEADSLRTQAEELVQTVRVFQIDTPQHRTNAAQPLLLES